MGKISDAIYEIHYMDTIANKESPIHRIHPLVKLIATIVYIWFTVSFDKYNVAGLLTMVIYPVVLFSVSDTSFRHSIKKLKVILPLILLMGIFNPIFEQTPRFAFYGMVVTNGMVSGFTLIVKGCFAVLGSYLLVATTTIESICYALNLLQVPKIIVTQILLTYRYITVLMDEANHIFEAYVLRAPFQKGVHFKVWGSLLGQLLLRSIDRAGALYDSMVLRGYNGDFRYTQLRRVQWQDFVYLVAWVGVFSVLRYTDFLNMVGALLI